MGMFIYVSELVATSYIISQEYATLAKNCDTFFSYWLLGLSTADYQNYNRIVVVSGNIR